MGSVVAHSFGSSGVVGISLPVSGKCQDSEYVGEIISVRVFLSDNEGVAVTTDEVGVVMGISLCVLGADSESVWFLDTIESVRVFLSGAEGGVVSASEARGGEGG